MAFSKISMFDIIGVCREVQSAKSITDCELLSECVWTCRDFVKCVLSSVSRGSAGCSACAVGAMRCL